MMKSAREEIPSKPKSAPKRKKPAETTRQQLRSFAPWINRFGCSMIRRMSKAADGGNVAIASNALFVFTGALSWASTEDDAVEACEALFVKVPPNAEKLPIEMSKMFEDQASCKWAVHQVIFLPSNRKLDDEYCEKIKDKFGVKVQALPGKTDAEAVEAINEFIRKESENRLTEAVSSEDIDLKKFANSMVAVVGVYVHPWWKTRFDKSATTEETFYVEESKPIQVPTMHQELTLPYAQADVCPGVAVQALGITCRGDGATVFLVVPVERFKLAEVVSHLTGDRAARLIDNCRGRRVRVSLPKMQMAFTSELRKNFSSLGVEAWLNLKVPAFEDFTKRGGAVSLGRIYHQVVLKLNEEGEEGGAEEANEEEKAVDFKCDQPFLILIHHTVTGAIWMMAEIKEPKMQEPKAS